MKLRGSVALLLALGPATARAQETAMDGATTPFIRAEAEGFRLGEARFRFVGANVAVIHGPAARAEMEATLDAVAHDGGRVVRVWAFGDIDRDAPPWADEYAFRRGPAPIESSFVHLDRVIVAARARGLRVILVLGNRWGDYGGARAHLRWADSMGPEDDADGATLATYWSCTRCRELYLEHVARVVERTNSVSGVVYRDDPTIMAWELINEASAQTAHSISALIAWIEAVAAFVRARDARHLISAGHIGYTTEREREVWRRVQSIAAIDYADAHAYPTGDPRVTIARLPAWIADRVELARSIGKPFVFGEVGFRTSGVHAEPRAGERMRGFLGTAFDRGAAGALVWAYGPEGSDGGGYRIATSDRERHASRTIRSALRQIAASLTNREIRSTPLPPFAARMIERRRPVRRDWQADGERSVLRVPVDEFTFASFERMGLFTESEAPHFWGAGEGEVTYSFVAPRGAPAALTLDVVMSSELPGRGAGASADDASTITVEIDGRAVGSMLAPPDDGRGAVVRWSLEDGDVLRSIFARPRADGGRGRSHTIRLRTDRGSNARGFCLYARSPIVLGWRVGP